MEYHPVVDAAFVPLAVAEEQRINSINKLQLLDFLPFIGMDRYGKRVVDSDSTRTEFPESRTREPTRLESAVSLGTADWPSNPELQREQRVHSRRGAILFAYNAMYALIPMGIIAYGSNKAIGDIAELVQKVV